MCMKMFKELFFILINVIYCSYGLQCLIPSDNYRLDCFPEAQANQNDCEKRGCCWAPPNSARVSKDYTAVPYCYYSSDFPNYQIKSLDQTPRGYKAVLYKKQQSYLPNEILNLNFEAIYETNSRIRIRITDPHNDRFVVPINLNESDPNPPTNLEYQIIIPTNGSFSFEVKRKSDGLSLFKSFGPLLYSNQFLQISTLTSVDHVYGIGEQNRPFLHNLGSEWERIGLWARDNAIETYNNLYGTHPFYMGMPSNGKAYGAYYFNSNGQEFGLQPAPAITYRTIGGILDIFLFTGGTPEKVVSQFEDLIGKPMLPPFWSLGFHLCRYGYKNISHISDVLFRNLNASIPVEVQWSDIDYMDAYKDFTVDPVNYKGMGTFIKAIKEKYGIKYIVIIDPGINIQNKGIYPSYDDGLEMNIFVRDSTNNKPLVGKVWPGDTVFPDFTHINITKYWVEQISKFYNTIPVDGLWIDMNEPSNFYDGSNQGCPGNSSYDNPFFVPLILSGSLIAKTICSSAFHYNNTIHYNLHNLYGYTESTITNKALLNVSPNKRVFILSRSTFSGSGKYTFHWTGDNTADWEQLSNSIRQILNFNMFGIPMTGADICGFNGNTNEELCIRWMQLGSFYPFMRNHNTLGAKDQDPASWSKKAQVIMRNAINLRYALLPNFYTLLVKSHLYGGTVMRPLSFEFYEDYVTHPIEKQFMIGSSLLINPVVTQGQLSISSYFPAGIWYDLNSFNVIHSENFGKWITQDSPLDKINVALRGGHIIAMLEPAMNTDIMRQNGFLLLCAFSMNKIATGELYWDDGVSLDSYTGRKYSHINFSANNNTLVTTPEYIGYQPIPSIWGIVVLGIKEKSISNVTINDKNVNFTYVSQLGYLLVKTENVTMATNVIMKWK